MKKDMKIIKHLFLTIMFAFGGLISFNTYGQIDDDFQLNTEPVIRLIADDPIVAMLDSMLQLQYFEIAKKNSPGKIVNRKGYASDSIPMYDESVYSARMAKLAARSPVSLDYNPIVQGYINLYALRKREQVMRMLGLAEYYFPLFEEKLDKHDMPMELKYLAIVESALNANAKSRVGATGLWQFMYGTGKMYNLKIDSYIDERSDPYKATDAACQYMKFLYRMFGDWQLVLAAYNAGPGTVNKAIRRSGGKKNYWELRPFLPVETRGYVPAFIAANYIMNYPEEHNIHPIKPAFYKHEVDTIKISEQVHFEQISAVLGIPISHLEFLNPTYKQSLIPKSFGDHKNTLCLPSNMISKFLNNDSLIYAYNKKPEIDYAAIAAQKTEEVTKKIYVVKKGEKLNIIARKLNCEVGDIKEWNKLKSTKLFKGQRLVIHNTVKKSVPATALASNETKKTIAVKPNPIKADSLKQSVKKELAIVKTSDSKKKVHVVKKGENLNSIARKYNCDISSLRKWNNLKKNKLFKGQKLIINSGQEKIATETAENLNEQKQTVTKTDSKQLNEDKTAKNDSEESKYVYYTVQSDDTLWKIANKYQGVTIDDIKKWNNIKNAKSLKVGTKIKIELNS